MVFVRIPDEWWRLSKDLSAEGRGLFIDALAYTCGDLSDCRLAKRDLHRCTYLPHVVVTTAMEELVAGGWWEDRGDHWWIGGHGIASHQYTRDQVMRYRAREREKKAKRRAEFRTEGSATALIPSQAKPSQDTPGGHPPGSPPGDNGQRSGVPAHDRASAGAGTRNGLRTIGLRTASSNESEDAS